MCGAPTLPFPHLDLGGLTLNNMQAGILPIPLLAPMSASTFRPNNKLTSTRQKLKKENYFYS